MDSKLMHLVADARQGDGSALGAVLEEVLPEVRAYVRVNAGARVREHESTSDLVQSICREVLEDLQDFQGEEARQFKKWLFTLALNKIRSRHRFRGAQRRDVNREVRAHAVSGSEDAGGGGFEALMTCYSRIYTPSRVAMAREEVDRLETAMESLPEDYRRVITLACIMGLPHKDVAEEMERPETAVRKMLSRARARLSMLIARSEMG